MRMRKLEVKGQDERRNYGFWRDFRKTAVSGMSEEDSLEPALAPGKAASSLKAMADSSTPVTKSLKSVSSVFITPPDSMERKKTPPLPHISPHLDPATRISPLLPTPGETPTLPPRPLRSRPKLRLDEGEDVVSGIHEGGYRLLIRQILDYLDPADLYNATLVCRRWSQLIASFTHLQSKIRLHCKELHRDVENMDKPYLSQVFGANRKPLGDAKNRLLTKNGHISTPSLPPHSAMAVPKRVMYKHRHCPQCKAPSKQLNHRRAECTNCRFDYCSLCLKTWHDGECERQRSPKRTSVENSAGSKRSKKNLRRL